ncbi:MAG: hypothetical protein PHG91_08180 [Syntrophales bacterium]|nr:hypothetical protein [Syntrophales bacterium]MDD5233360.1 hypothetical protein [Syntrophales bacterium]MDD5532905.1 hypothetical protein [Syntrophales bacterium]
MFEHEYLIREPLFYLFIAFSFLLGLGFFWGKRANRKIFLSAFNDLLDVIKPVDQTFTNIGGLIGYHASFVTRKKGAIEKVDATITFLPRQSWLYFPISRLIRKYDRLFITLYLRGDLPAEGHLIEAGYARFRGPKITNADRLQKETVKWGKLDFHLYYGNMKMREKLLQYAERNPDPGTIRHIALVPHEKKCFVFMIPRKGEVGRYFGPVYSWLPSVIRPAD